MRFFSNFLLIFGLLANCTYAQISIMPNNEDILYTGRFSFADKQNPSFSMSATSIKIGFEGTGIKGRFSSQGGSSYLYIIVDGVDNPLERKIVEVSSLNEMTYDLIKDVPFGIHTLEIVKLNESDTKVTFHGFILEGTGLIEKPIRPSIQLEFIGDSNTSGWSAWNAYDEGGNEASGAYFTFPGITSRMLGAEFSLIGAGGSGVADRASWNLTKFYDRIHLKDAPSEINKWNFYNNYWDFKPQAVIVNLGANDHYPKTPKQEIKDGWKNFITNQLRKYYPEAHIVLANSYGWAYGEPADYVNEAIIELKEGGDSNVSFVRFPWLWGQAHAVINEHAGFANILALHLAEVLNLPKPELSLLSSIAKDGELYNGGFEKSILPGIADGWRPHGVQQLIKDSSEAFEGERFIRIESEGWINFPVRVTNGMKLKLKGFVKSDNLGNTGFLKILFKDQGQKTIKTQQLEVNPTNEWRQYETEILVPEGIWSAWVVLEAASNSRIDFDDISLEILASN